MQETAEVRKRLSVWLGPAKAEDRNDVPEAGQHPVRIQNRTRPRLTIGLLVASDVIAIVLAAAVALIGRGLLDGAIASKLHMLAVMWPGAGIFVLACAIGELYPGTALMPPEELRRISYITTAIFVGLGSALFMTKTGDLYSRGAFVAGWALTIFLVPCMRMMVRQVCARRPWWGQAAIVLGAGETGRAVVRKLTKTRRLGLTPVALLDDDEEKHGTYVEGVPVIGRLEKAPRLRRELRVDHAIVAMPGYGRAHLMEVIDRYCRDFPSQIVIPDLEGLSTLWVSRRDLSGVLGLEVRQQLLLRGPRLLKRMLDLVFVAVLAVPVAALTAVIALLIKLESRGPIFYGQDRIGSGGRRFVLWKFRTMVWNADKVLGDYLEKHPELREEWERDHKLRHDPRVTRIGRILRRTSLDELPQFWNVLKGEMSLVGPRPIVQAEMLRYGRHMKEYASVRPGITGLWQISGRNDTGYAERIELDLYYVRNWSPWLDLYVLAKTFGAVISKKGAY